MIIIPGVDKGFGKEEVVLYNKKLLCEIKLNFVISYIAAPNSSPKDKFRFMTIYLARTYYCGV